MFGISIFNVTECKVLDITNTAVELLDLIDTVDTLYIFFVTHLNFILYTYIDFFIDLNVLNFFVIYIYS